MDREPASSPPAGTPASERFRNAFDAKAIEPALRAYWEEKKFYRGIRDPRKKPYTIVIPPPNVTGDLTMGHVMNNSLQDILIRWHRARGFAACWIPGTDHASIATEAKVTKLLKDQGIDKRALGRQKFLEHAWEWKAKYGGRIESALKHLGASCDWERSVFTMDEGYSKAVIKAFVTLYKQGLVYKSQRLVNWCPVSQSVISDEEVNPEERNGHLWHIKYPIQDRPGEFVVVATTRPETLFGDLAVAVHPDDERYKGLVGKKVQIPVSGRWIPVIADTYVDKEFGTGVVKITPAHDPNDFQVGARHRLGLLNVMHPDASMNAEAPEAYRGLDRYVARKKLVAEIDAAGLLEKTLPHRMVVGISERGAVPIEYYLSDQWYFSMEGMARKALEATRSKRLQFYPAHNEKIWEHWLTNIQDWCVSRQLWWGHRIPIYTCQSCKHVMCEESAPPGCEKCSGTLKQEEDVLDTWASSWVWPFGVHSWANPTEEQKKDLEYFYPTDIIVTGADIIFFWIARMVMAGEQLTGKTPFHSTYFTPIIRDAQGRKMSKSLGNSPDIFGLMEKYGTDALRFSVVNQIVMGQDLMWADSSCEIGRTFANKIWNATRYLLMACEKLGVDAAAENHDALAAGSAAPADPLGRWMVSEWFNAVGKAHKAIESYRFADYTGALYEFVWMVYCDWFIELTKPLFQDPGSKLAAPTLRLAMQMLDGVLRMLHPVMPFVTEEIWQQLDPQARAGKTIGFEALPEPQPGHVSQESIGNMRRVQEVVNAVRTIRGQFSIHPGTELSAVIQASPSFFGDLLPQLEFLAKAKFRFQAPRPALCSSTLAGGAELSVDLQGLVDPAKELDRVTKQIAKLESVAAGIEKRLGNAEFVASAPAQIVEGAKAQLAANQAELKLLRESAVELRKLIP